MNERELFTAGNEGFVPQGDAARQAVDSLRGYAYQVTAAALAWLDLDDRDRLFLEVAEDYAVVARSVIEAAQVKDTLISGTVTLNTGSVQDAVSNFVSLQAGNPNGEVKLRYFTTSAIGTERAVDERPGGIAGLMYWRKAATGADVRPLRSILESDKFSTAVQQFVKARDDESLRNDMLRKIHWDCGRPDLGALRRELEERLVVVGRDVFRLAASEATRLAEPLIYRVLERSIAKSPADRVLTRADLYRGIDQATRISVPRAAADMMALVSSGLAASVLASLGVGLPVALAEPGWLVDSNALPPANRMVPRIAIQTELIDRMRRLGTSIVVGASGLGKSSLARLVARSLTDEFVMIDLRKADAEDTRSRLDAMVPRIGGLRAPTVIFDDLNHFSDPILAPSIARIFEALRRRDRSAIVTCYLSPTAKALSDAGLDAGCSVECPYFTEQEAAELVSLHGGDPKLWGRLAYVSGAFGHPQLVHAFIAGMGARGWPRSEVRDIVDRGLSSGDVDAERETARRTLVSVLPGNARDLLYRLSLTVGRFDRAMAMTIANASPPITQAGECLDALIGPWLETLGRDRYRVSPLAARSGHGMLAPAEQARIHGVIATQFMASGTINGGQIDIIMMHAMLGKKERVLFRLAHSVLVADERTLGLLADAMTTIKLLRTDRPIYPDNMPVSVMVRLAQFKILVTARETDKLSECASALFLETEQQPDSKMRRAFRAVSFAIVLSTMGIANYLDNWLDKLQHFQAMTEADEVLNTFRGSFDEKRGPGSNLFGMLFAIGSAGPSSVARLEALIDQLDEVEPGRRSLYLSALGETSSDYSVFINSAWSLEHQRDAVNAADAAERYRRMANKTASWGVRPVTLQCWVARAIMLDEYAKDREGALRVLDGAVEALGADVLLSRARAKIYWRAQDHEQALSILRKIADEVGRDNPVERCFALREAAISAAKSGDWAQAETWFLESKQAAAQVQVPDMTVMAVGLGADAAVAALQIEEVERALRGMGDALTALGGIDPASSLRAMYCHQVVRHTLLWAQVSIDKRRVEIAGAPIVIEPGCCSNPEPPEAITERPLGPLDLVWYMLAESEVTSGKNVGIADSLYDRLTGGPTPVMEIDLRVRRVKRDITDLNPGGFARDVWSHLEAMVHLTRHGRQLQEMYDVFKPARGDIPPAPRNDLSDPMISALANDAVLAYAIAAACRHSAEALSGLESALKAEFGSDIPGATLLVRANATGRQVAASSFDEALIDAVKWFRSGVHPTPKAHCSAAVQFFQQARRSNFKSYLMPIVGAWQRIAWTRIVGSETFRLSRPLQTVPGIKAALSTPGNDERFLGALFLAAASATAMTMPHDVRTELETLAAMPTAA